MDVHYANMCFQIEVHQYLYFCQNRKEASIKGAHILVQPAVDTALQCLHPSVEDNLLCIQSESANQTSIYMLQYNSCST